MTSVEQTVLAEELMAALRRLIRRRVPTEACGPPLRGATAGR
ncbi:MAG TPA: hypothetical protein VFN75_01305 [Pseudonocardiaceae bacterium]|nr:hypothetical protein [Pseudonocardiaceae bacterium]